MNYDRMLAIADHIANPTYGEFPVRFDMGTFCDFPGAEYDSYVGHTGNPCQTMCCIAGHACLMFGARGSLIGEVNAAVLLDLNDKQLRRLFYNDDHYISRATDLDDIIRSEAVAAIRRMVAEDTLEHGAATVEAEELAYA